MWPGARWQRLLPENVGRVRTPLPGTASTRRDAVSAREATCCALPSTGTPRRGAWYTSPDVLSRGPRADATERAGSDFLMRSSRGATLAAAVLLALALGACSRHAKEQEPSAVSPDSLPPPALTDRAQRDSARVAEVFLAYFRFMAKHDSASVR